MTNADRIRVMTDEELVEVMLDGCRFFRDECPNAEWSGSTEPIKSCWDCCFEWLKQEVDDV